MKTIASVFLSIIIFISPAYASRDAENIKDYIENLVDKGYELVNDKNLTELQKRKDFSRLIRTNLYIDWMARYALGRNRRILTDDQINKFIKIYSKFIVKVYVDLTDNYSSQKALLKGVKKISDDMFIVNMEIMNSSDQQPIKIDYLVYKLENKKEVSYKIGDIITEDISILNSQQSEFNSVISSRGIGALIIDLQKKVKANKIMKKN